MEADPKTIPAEDLITPQDTIQSALRKLGRRLAISLVGIMTVATPYLYSLVGKLSDRETRDTKTMRGRMWSKQLEIEGQLIDEIQARLELEARVDSLQAVIRGKK